MPLLDPPTCAIKAAAEYRSVLTEYIKEQTEVYKRVWSEKGLSLVEDLSESLISVPARIVWTRVCNSGGLFHGGCVTGFMG